MTIKRYEGEYVHEVIARIREELGPEAVVLHTRWRNPAGLKRLLGKQGVEVWAAEGDDAGEAADLCLDDLDDLPVEEPAIAGPTALRAQALRQMANSLDEALGKNPPESARRARLEELPEPTRRGRLEALPEPPRREERPQLVNGGTSRVSDLGLSLGRLERKLDGLREWLESGGLEAHGSRCQALIEAGIDPQIANEMVAKAVECSITELLYGTLMVAPEWPLGGHRVVALVGPSGAGKTTCVAKLAARCSVRTNRRVLMISSDTQRVGTFEQIEALGGLMQLPVCLVRSPAEAANRIASARGAYDLVLLDTPSAGSSSEDRNRLCDLLTATQPDEVQAVIPATMRSADLARWFARLDPSISPVAAMVTKLDETDAPGLIAELAWRWKVPVSFLSEGPDIPGDLRPAEKDELLGLIWSRRLKLTEEVTHG